MSLDEKIELKIYFDRVYNGVAGNKKYIIISNSLLKLYESNPQAVRCMIVHELTHIKYRDFALSKMINTFGIAFSSNYSRAISLLMEIRAEVESFRINEFTEEEFTNIHTLFNKQNKNPSKLNSYKVGYPSRDLTIAMCIKHKAFTTELINDILNDFCDVMKIKKKRKLVERVKSKFDPNKSTILLDVQLNVHRCN
ncbi:hypothetical protein GCM10008018_59120 [Paenibacillus marchantiophytorum]|uniref:Peptidase M48 domain-containing protein n=1 Tax=Paenibacillus marchantiophytorum TaxID=1619310 RepID=A0ABQ1FBU5_9BACL|nr:M48 family metalloprotease [Paenibacillus marchantiophytorum]GGA05217.1 hypothetical protein GCM10008018_59120 [Paenibacillus marchantiophytorum]